MQTEEIVFEMQDMQEKNLRVYCFVCTGNTCRSPMAAAVVNHFGKAKGIRAFSRGIAAEVGAPISENAAKALAEADIPSAGHNDYARHRAMQFTKADFENCDGVFAISPSHANALIMAFPEYAGKIRVLGDIADPYGGDLARYKDCLDDITRALRAQLPSLFGDAD